MKRLRWFLKLSIQFRALKMFLLGIVLAVLAFPDVTFSAPIENEIIEPVDLYHQCYHVIQEKASNKTPILLIHGLGGSHDAWRGVSQVLALQTARRVCAVDLRNHGDSPWNNRTDAEALAKDIGNFLDKQKIQKVNLVGHSLGGKTAVHYTLNNPDRVDSLVVEDMRPNGATESSIILVKYVLKYLQEAIQTVPEGVNEQEAKSTIVKFLNKKTQELGSTDTIDENTELPIRLVNEKWQWKMNLYLWQKKAENPDDLLTKSTGLFEGPTLFIYGTASPFDVPGDKENIIKLFPNAQLVPVQGAGHLIHGKYRQFEDEVIKFFNQIK